MKEVPAHEILAKFFQTIVEEAKTNPRFAEHMLEAFPETLVAKIDHVAKNDVTNTEITPEQTTKADAQATAKIPATLKPAQTQPVKNPDKFDLKAHNPIIMFRQTGEDLMRVKLNKQTVTNLKKIAKHYQLNLGPVSKKKSPTKSDLTNAILSWAKNYDAQRKGAAG